MARRIALDQGLRHVYTGNVRDTEGGSTHCPGCGQAVIVRDGYVLKHYALDARGACTHCGTPVAGRWEARPGTFGARRIPVRLAPR